MLIESFWICPLTTPLTNWLTQLSVPYSVQEQIDSKSPQNSEPRIAKTVPLVFFFLFCFVSIKLSCSPIFQVWVSRLVNPEPPFVVQNGWRVYDVPLSGKAKGVFCFFFLNQFCNLSLSLRRLHAKGNDFSMDLLPE